MTARRRRSIRWIAGGAVVAATLALGYAGLTLPRPTATATAEAVSIDPEPSATVLACTGPVLAVGRDAANAALVTDALAPTVTAAPVDGDVPATELSLRAVDVAEGPDPHRSSVCRTVRRCGGSLLRRVRS